MTLELLPPEIQCLIMKQMPNVKTLHSLLGSSPRFLQVFLHNSKETIIQHVTCNYITPDILPIAVMALEQRQKRPVMNRKAVDAFLDDFREQDSVITPSSFSLETCKALFTFHNCVERFIFDFSKTTLQIIETFLDRPSAEESIQRSLSLLEYHRIARGFYHMDLYGHVFRGTTRPSVGAGHRQDFPTLEQGSKFLQQLYEWELEEFLCVRTYLLEKSTAFLNRVEDHCLQAFENLPPPYRLETDGRWKHRAASRWDYEDSFFSSREHDNGEFSGGSERYPVYQKRWMEGFLTRGLVKIEALVATRTFADELAAIGPRTWVDWTLSHAMSAITIYRDPNNSIEQRHTPRPVLVKEMENFNEAWLWTWKCLDDIEFNWNQWLSVMVRGQRRWGYVMWDQQRLLNLGVMDKRPEDVAYPCQDILKVARNISVQRRVKNIENHWVFAGLAEGTDGAAMGTFFPRDLSLDQRGWNDNYDSD